MIYWDQRGIRQCDGLAHQVTEVPSLLGRLESKGHVNFILPPFRILCLNLFMLALRLLVGDSSAHQRKLFLLLVGPEMCSK